MLLIDHVMIQLLVGMWFGLSSVVCLNLLIAQFSYTFQSVYDNAVENAMMQKAIILMQIHENLGLKNKRKWCDFLRERCDPLEEDHDPDHCHAEDESVQKTTHEILDVVKDVKKRLTTYFNVANNAALGNENAADETAFSKDFKVLNNRIDESDKKLEAIRNDMVILHDNLEKVQVVLKDIAAAISVGTVSTSQDEKRVKSKQTEPSSSRMIYVEPAS